MDELREEYLKKVHRVFNSSGVDLWRAIDIRTESEVAFKSIKLVVTNQIKERIVEELRRQFEYVCANIVKYQGAFVTTDGIGICTTYMPEGSLEKLAQKMLQMKKKFPEEILGTVVSCVVNALIFLHGRYSIHGNIKPRNILLDVNGNFKVCDPIASETLNRHSTSSPTGSYDSKCYSAVSVQ